MKQDAIGYDMIKMAGIMTLFRGCMTESSCMVSVVAHLLPLVDRTNTNGNIHINNYIRKGLALVSQRIITSDRPENVIIGEKIRISNTTFKIY